MLDGSLRALFCHRYITKCILLASLFSEPVFAASFIDSKTPVATHVEHEWVSRYLSSINEETSVEEVVDFLVSLKGSFVSKGYKMPSLCDLCLDLRQRMIDKGIEIDDEDIELIYDEIEKRESTLVQQSSFRKAVNKGNFTYSFIRHRHRSRGENKDKKVNSKTVFGFVKILTGSLLCCVPFPVVQATGALLVGNGINDCIDGAREQGDDNEKKGPLANPPAQYHNEILKK